MAQTRIDELNTLGNKNSSDVFDREEFINHYFDTMQISKKQKKNRIDAAEDIFDAVLLFLMWCENAPERVQEENTQRSFENMYKEVIFQYGEPDNYFDIYVPLFIADLVQTTLEHQNEEYFYSVERAANVAVNESNLVLGHVELQQAIEDGYTYKTWVTELDEKVRMSHRNLEGMTIPIDEPFIVGNSLMLVPKDQYTFNAEPREIVNCRCTVKFSKGYKDYQVAEQARHTGTEETSVDWHTVRSKEYTERFSYLSMNEKANGLVAQYARKALSNRDGLDTEEIYAINMTKGTLVSKIIDQHNRLGIERTEKFNTDVNRTVENGDEVLLLHNHPYNSVPSVADLNELLNHKNVSGITVGHKGSIYYYSKPNGHIEESDFIIAKMHNKAYNGKTLIEEKAMQDLAIQYEFDFRVL